LKITGVGFAGEYAGTFRFWGRRPSTLAKSSRIPHGANVATPQMPLIGIRAASEVDVVALVEIQLDAVHEPGMPFGMVAFIVMAVGAEALWLGPIGWWLLHLFRSISR
jgi:hypothetical protein